MPWGQQTALPLTCPPPFLWDCTQPLVPQVPKSGHDSFHVSHSMKQSQKDSVAHCLLLGGQHRGHGLCRCSLAPDPYATHVLAFALHALYARSVKKIWPLPLQTNISEASVRPESWVCQSGIGVYFWEAHPSFLTVPLLRFAAAVSMSCQPFLTGEPSTLEQNLSRAKTDGTIMY